MDTVSNVSQAHVVIVPMVVTTIIAVILTLLRLYVRIRMIKLFGWDDFFNVLAMVRTLPTEFNPDNLFENAFDCINRIVFR